jgi:hypothetical protein
MAGNPNIVNVTSIYGGTATTIASNSLTALVTNAAASGTIIKVDTLIFTNIDSAGHTVTADVYRSPTSYPISYNVSVPPAAIYDAMAKYIYLLEGDVLRVSADVASKVSVVCSYEIIAGPAT